ncbi:OmpA family protein [Myroides odoratus]|uniref:OmpA family protein n=1 Tax=Myroides odoratus TaxID=256 RepID=UPI0039B08878
MIHKIVHIGLLSLFISFGISSYSQVKKEKLAALNFDRLAYSDAIDIYETLATKGYVNTSILQNLADAYYFKGEFSEANQWYSRLFEGDYKDKAVQKLSSEYYYWYSQTLKSDDFNTAHPALTPDENWLYFSSDRQGSVGQSDLYRVALYENGGYGSVENLGREINTEGRESFAFISVDHQLYFSSDGHPGLGGFDVFVSKIYPDGRFGPVVNLGKPINSNGDDFGFYIDFQENKGFVSSNREGGKGSDDIYFFAEKPCEQTLEGKMYDKRTNDVRSHTDSKGKDAYNLSLSDRRAKSTIQWIIGQGIAPSRLTGRGYGETQLLNLCSNGVRCSEEQHQENRRSAFIILEK